MNILQMQQITLTALTIETDSYVNTPDIDDKILDKLAYIDDQIIKGKDVETSWQDFMDKVNYLDSIKAS